jgi:undecaprenyl-diphosphatase
MDWVESLVLGIVQGITEFLPVSSDGHLVITQGAFAWLGGRERSGAENLFYDVMLHLGTLLAVVVYFRAVVKTGAQGLAGAEDVPPAYRRGAIVRTAILAGIATTPLVPLKLFFLDWIEKSFESLAAAGIGFLITAGVLLLTLRLQDRGEGGKGPAETTWLDALLIGIAQMFAPLPGVSRSGLTVAAALGLGLSRAWAVGFSLLIMIPAVLGAVVFQLKKLDPSTLSAARVGQTVAAMALAGVLGYGAIIWLVKIVRSGRMWYFSVYLVVLGLAVLAASAAGLGAKPTSNAVPGAARDARFEESADGPTGRADPGALAGARQRLGGGALAGADGLRPRSGRRQYGSQDRIWARASSLVLGTALARGRSES